MTALDLGDLPDRLDDLLADVRTRPRPARTDRQPVHTVYVPADRVVPGLAADWGREALAQLATFHAELSHVHRDIPSLLDLVRDKLEREPIEDLRIDFEDGYGVRPSEDADALAAAVALATDIHAGVAPARHGLRFKSLDPATRERGLRTLFLFVGELAARGTITPGLVLTLPKVTSRKHASAMVAICEQLESAFSLAPGSLRFELQIELPEAVVDHRGCHPAGGMLRSSRGRLLGFHYGTYDYSAAVGVAGPHQSSDHPVADYAKSVLLAGVAGSGVDVVDGSTNRLPVGSPAEVLGAWQEHFRLVTRALRGGLYQGWDLHPGQLVTRHAATIAFYRADLDGILARLEGQGESYADEPATHAAMRDFVSRARDCGAGE